jgi:orotate phosphoribosyltransferase
MSPEDLIGHAKREGALLEGHFLLSSGLHSPYYFQCARLLARPELARELGGALAEKIGPRGANFVIAPALGGILVAHEVARALGVRALFAERDPASGRLTLRRGFAIEPGETAVVLEDVVTTGRSLRETVEVVEAHGGKVIATGALVDRGGERKDTDGPPFFSLARLDFPTYQPTDCPLCREGSTAIKPGSRPQPAGG